MIIKCGVRDVDCGKNVRICEWSNLYECTLADDCFVGPFVEIQRGVSVGARTKIQSHAFICEMVTIGIDCFISHGVKFINDTFATGQTAKGDKAEWKKTAVGNRVLIGTNATILPVHIADDVVIGAGAVVTKDILQPGTYVGNPARLLKRS